MKSIFGSRNRLVRRLRSHTNMTGLFHVGEAVQRRGVRSAEPGMDSAANATGLPLAKAFMPLPEPAGEANMASSLELPPTGSRPGTARVEAPAPAPSGNIFRAPQTEPIALPAREADLVPPTELPLAGSSPGNARVEPPAPVPSGSVLRAPQAEQVELPAAEEKSQSSDGDPVWNRLQNIFNRHREKKNLQESDSLPGTREGASTPPHIPAPGMEVTEQDSAPTVSDPPVGNEPGAPTVHSIQTKRETASPPPVEQAGVPAPGIKSEANFARTEQRSASVETPSPDVASPTDVIQAASESSPTNLLPSTRADREIITKPHPNTDNVHDVPGLNQGEGPSSTLSQPIIESPGAPAPNLQSLPLEAVWAVETARQPQATHPPVLDASDQHVSAGEGSHRQIENTHADRSSVQRAVVQDQIVRSALQDVHPAQATASGIEFIPPRGPRPVSMPAASDAPVTENFAAQENTLASEHALQRQVIQNPVQAAPNPGNEPTKPGVVPTEIGPLPEDLWNLVGAESPATRIERPQERPAPMETSQWEQALPSTSASPPATPRAQASQAPVVQRQAASASAPEPGSATPAAGEDAVGEQAGEELDIEELARQVYSELRHRLGLEWERLRRR